MLSQWLRVMVCNAEQVIANHGLLCCPKVVNDCVLHGASDCESWCAMLCKWLRVMMSYAEPVVVSHGE